MIRYYGGAVAHGLLRSLVLQPREGPRQLLVAERLGAIAINTAINPLVCPMTLMQDIVGIEAWARGIDTHLHKPRLIFAGRNDDYYYLKATK